MAKFADEAARLAGEYFNQCKARNGVHDQQAHCAALLSLVWLGAMGNKIDRGEGEHRDDYLSLRSDLIDMLGLPERAA